MFAASGCPFFLITIAFIIIFSEENFIFEPVILPKTVSWIYARADWENKQGINAEINLIEENKKDNIFINRSVSAPDYGGYWNKEWKYYFDRIFERATIA